MQKKIILSLSFVLFSLGLSYAQRNSTNDLSPRHRNWVSSSSDNTNRGGCVESPYDENDPAYLQTIAFDPYCCEEEWDALCESQYQIFNGACDAEAPYELSDENYVIVLILDDYCCNTAWDEQCEFHYEHVVYGCNALSPYGPSDSIWEIVITEDDYCCDSEWDEICQELYDLYSSSASLETAVQTTFRMHPNPASEFVKLRLSNSAEIISTVQIFDNSGVLVMELSPNQAELILNTQEMTAGTYHVVVLTANTVLNQKLVLIK